jgi:hypothetical protein
MPRRLQALLQVSYVRPSPSILRGAFGSLLEWCARKGAPANDSEQRPLLQPEGVSSVSQMSGKILEVLRIRNRFVNETSTEHSSGGFRDLAFKVKVGFQVR